MTKAIGVWAAQAILILTGNLALAASLRALPIILSLPLRLTVRGKLAHLEYPSGPQEWDCWNRQMRLPTSLPDSPKSEATQSVA